jgi:hypothetical protein
LVFGDFGQGKYELHLLRREFHMYLIQILIPDDVGVL